MTDATGPDLRRGLLAIGIVALVSLVLGGLTSPLQGVLPSAVSSFANSVSGWTILTALLVLAVRPASTAVAAVAGGVSFVLLVLGYQAVSTWRGHPTSEVFFLVAGVVAGPFVGVAAAWTRESGRRAALGGGLLAGILVGEGIYDLTVVVSSIGPVYGCIVTVLGVALVAALAVHRVPGRTDRGVLVGITAAVALLFDLAYTLLGTIG